MIVVPVQTDKLNLTKKHQNDKCDGDAESKSSLFQRSKTGELFSLSTKQLVFIWVSIQMIVLLCILYYGYETLSQVESVSDVEKQFMDEFWTPLQREKHFAMLKTLVNF